MTTNTPGFDHSAYRVSVFFFIKFNVYLKVLLNRPKDGDQKCFFNKQINVRLDVDKEFYVHS